MKESQNVSLNVQLSGYEYPIEIGYDLEQVILEKVLGLQKIGVNVVVIVDSGLRKKNSSFLQDFLESCPTLTLPSGETTKSAEYLLQIWDFLSIHKVDRSSAIFAVGGGVIGDLAGFAAATYLRGIDLYQIPTTLLSMVDSSVGGKTGINLTAGKNLVGAFHQPKGVFMDLNVLATLPDREFSAGMAEVIKYGLIGNQRLFQELSERNETLTFKSEELVKLVATCCMEKAKVVQADERETASGQGGRALLNLGHTFAHAIEAVAGYGDYLHGEAVAIGLVCAMRLSKSIGYCLTDSEEGLEKTLLSFGLPIRLRKPLPTVDLMDRMKSDKKVKHGKLRFVLLKNFGCAFVTDDVQNEKVNAVWQSIGAS